MRKGSIRDVLVGLGAGSLGLMGVGVTVAGAGTPGGWDQPGAFAVQQVLAGSSLHHTFTPPGSSTTLTEALSDPDDISRLGGDLFVGFQNGVGPQGQASTDGNLDSTIVELTLHGTVVGQWDVAGKADGVTADPATGSVIATVNEDANSSLYTIDPTSSAAVQHYSYSEPLPHDGGTDAISVYFGRIFISASAPGTTGTNPAPQPTFPAAYSVTLDAGTSVAAVTPLFSDEDTATVANIGRWGQQVTLALTDPDSNAVVPIFSPRFGGDFELTSQGDLQQIDVRDPGGPRQQLSVLNLSQSVDDTAWATDPSGRLYSTDSADDAVDVVTGPFRWGQELAVATPCGANSAPSTCPGPGYPANYLASLDPWTGQVSGVEVQGVPYVPQGGLVFVAGWDR
jgi:hypothetical protein